MTDLATGAFATQDLNQVRTSLEGINLSSQKVSQSLAKTFASAIVAGKSFDQTLQGVLASLSKMALTSALQPVTQGITSSLNSLISGMLGGLTGGAASATSVASQVQPFADGGVVAQPTFFGSNGGLGLMGERGAEAILPLARGPGGQLGVVSQGQAGGANITVNITTPDVNSFHQSQVQVAGALARAVVRGQRGL
jgi:phage-related minor tail protein